MRAAFSSTFHKAGSTSIPGKRENAHNILVGMPSPSAANAAAASFAALVEKLDYLSATDIDMVRRAYRFSDEAHLGQLRKNGEPYITHPISVATQCTEWKLDAQALMAALMHDVMEDCGVTKADLIEKFGSSVAELVDGLTKLDKLEFNTREENQSESFRKMLLAMARDVRVILIKLADRTHNMRTMSDMRAKNGREFHRRRSKFMRPLHTAWDSIKPTENCKIYLSAIQCLGATACWPRPLQRLAIAVVI